MPPHVALYEDDGTPLAGLSLPVSVEGGEESTPLIIRIINDRDDLFLDTTTAQDVRLKLIASEAGGTYRDAGVAVLDERWTRFRVLGKIVDDVDSLEGATSTMPFGTNATVPVGDMAPQEGWRVELKVVAPGGRTANAIKLGLVVDDNVSSSPLASMTALAPGSSIVPADRVAGLRAFIRGSEVTADGTDTVTIARGALVYEGVTVAFPETEETFNLNDSAAVALLSGEDYRVTLSRADDGTLTVTKGPKNEALEYPDTPVDELFVAHLTVASADGIAVTVAQASVIETARVYAEYRARAGTGLSVVISTGEGVTSPSDHWQFLSHEVVIGVDASATSRIWRLTDGSLTDTLTDVPPEFGADLMWLVTTDPSAVTGIVDARVFAHRAVMMWPVELVYRAVFADVVAPAHGVVAALVPFDGEIESVTEALSGTDPSWTGGEIKIDLRTFAPGTAAPVVAGGLGTGGVSIYTSSATDDARPAIAFDATNLRVVSLDHEVRRVLADTWVLLSVISTVAGPGGEPEQEIRVRLNMRRYR